MLLAAFAVVLSSPDASAQGKAGTQPPRAGTLDRTDTRSQPGTWRTTPEQRQNTETRETTSPAMIQTRQVAAGTSVTSTIQDTTRRRRDTVRSPEPIPTPPVPPAPPMPRDTPQRR